MQLRCLDILYLGNFLKYNFYLSLKILTQFSSYELLLMKNVYKILRQRG